MRLEIEQNEDEKILFDVRGGIEDEWTRKNVLGQALDFQNLNYERI